jgi:hypothetical protein
MAENADTMVLRSFHLPQSMDDELRGLAFALRCAKADLVRFFIKGWMTSLAERYGPDWNSWDPAVLEQLAHDVQERGASESVEEGILRDIALLGDEVPAYESELRVRRSQATS